MMRKLSRIATHLVVPEGIVSTEFPAVEKIAKSCGVQFDDWQRTLGSLVLAKRADGLFAAGTGDVVMSIPRQIGKTFTTAWDVVGECLLHSHTTALWTAHVTRTSDETFKFMQSLANSVLKPWVSRVRAANGQQAVEFKNGSRILFGAREQGFGRGFSNVSMIILDEAQILSEKTMEDMVPSTNAARNPLIMLMGTPPKPSDNAEVFESKRKQALEQAPRDMLYVEFSADRDADPDDRAEWRKANPSYPGRVNEASIIRMRNNLGPDGFRREGLGIWDETEVKAAISPEQWEKTAVPSKPEDATPAIGIDMTPDRSALAIGCCWRKGDTAHVQLVRYEDPHTKGTEWAVQWVADRWSKLSAVVIDAQSPAMTLLPDFQAARVRVTVTRTLDLARACGRFADMLAAGKLTHRPDSDQPALAQAVKGATTRPVGPAGAFAWNRRDRDTDISPLMAVTLAIHGAWTSKRHPGRKQEMWS